MIDLIKMDMHRLFRTGSFYFGLIFSAAISAVTILAIAGMNMLVDYMGDDSVMALSMMVSTLTWSESVSLSQIMFTGLSTLSLLVICMVSAVYISEEQLSGYVKNIAGQVRNKGMMIRSKFITLAVLVLCIMLVYCLAAAAMGALFFHKSLHLEGMEAFLPAFFVKYLLYLAVDTVILFLCTMTKSKSLAIAIGVIFGAGVTNVAYTFCDAMLQFVLKLDISVRAFVPDGLISTVDLDWEPTALVKGTVVAICYMVLFGILSSVFMKKRDTR